MKKLLRMAIGTIMVFGLFLPGLPAYATSVQVTLPTFDVTLNGIKIDNAIRQYPLIVYKDITYFPMTYDDCRFLGLESDYTTQTGLDIDKTDIGGRYNDYKMQAINPKKATAQTVAFPIRLNGKTIDNSKEAYPLLIYKDITYFPLTWRFAVEEFGWNYSFDHSSGLVINSNNNYSKEYLIALGQEAIEKLQTSEWLTYTFRNTTHAVNNVTGILREHPASGTKWYSVTTATENDYDDEGYLDNTKNPTTIAHYLLLDGKLYYSENGTNWQPQDPASFVFPAVPALAEMMQTLSDSDYEDAYKSLSFNYESNKKENRSYRYISKSISYGDEIVMVDGLWRGGYNHGFDIHLGGTGLISYSKTPQLVMTGENGELLFATHPFVFDDVIDIDYQPFTIPIP